MFSLFTSNLIFFFILRLLPELINHSLPCLPNRFSIEPPGSKLTSRFRRTSFGIRNPSEAWKRTAGWNRNVATDLSNDNRTRTTHGKQPEKSKRARECFTSIAAYLFPISISYGRRWDLLLSSVSSQLVGRPGASAFGSYSSSPIDHITVIVWAFNGINFYFFKRPSFHWFSHSWQNLFVGQAANILFPYISSVL